MSEKSRSVELGEEKISKLILKQSIPASIGILVLSLYMIVDTIFVGQWVNSMAIAAISVVMPIMYFISSVGMAIGLGGGSIISRALGAGDKSLANRTFAIQIMITLITVLIIVVPGFWFEESILKLAGGKGAIFEPAKEYYELVLLGIPFLAFAMMANSVVRAIGRPKVSMRVMMIPAVVNIALDPLFIYVFDWGVAGAALATTISYISCAGYVMLFFIKGQDELKIEKSAFRFDGAIVKEITSLGSVTVARQGAIALLSVVLNNSLIVYGGEIYVSVFGVISRIMMMAYFPAIGLTQGILPIVGFNYGAKLYDRVKEAMNKAILYNLMVSAVLYIVILLFKEELVSIFSDDSELIGLTPPILLVVFVAMPLVGVQMISTAYFQAIGKAIPALMLTLSRQGFALIPLILILPHFYGIEGIWYASPIADVVSTIVTYTWMRLALRKLKG